MTDTRVTLTPLERLRLREVLQDHWREQVRRITELSVGRYYGLDDQDGVDDPVAVSVAMGAARLRLADIEQATRRLDDRSYGRCLTCLVPLPFTDLLQKPDARQCVGCRGSGTPADRRQ